MEKQETIYFEDLDPFIQEVIIELIASIIKEKRKKEQRKEVA